MVAIELYVIKNTTGFIKKKTIVKMSYFYKKLFFFGVQQKRFLRTWLPSGFRTDRRARLSFVYDFRHTIVKRVCVYVRESKQKSH